MRIFAAPMPGLRSASPAASGVVVEFPVRPKRKSSGVVPPQPQPKGMSAAMAAHAELKEIVPEFGARARAGDRQGDAAAADEPARTHSGLVWRARERRCRRGCARGADPAAGPGNADAGRRAAAAAMPRRRPCRPRSWTSSPTIPTPASRPRRQPSGSARRGASATARACAMESPGSRRSSSAAASLAATMLMLPR